jgi:hypothetical protein
MKSNPTIQAIEQLKSGDLESARELLDVSRDQLGDNEFTDCLMALDRGLSLTQNDRLTEALDHLRTSIPLVEACSDQELKTVVSVLVRYSEGLKMLHQGDATGALQSLEAASGTLDRLSFFDAEFAKSAASAEVAACVALARANMNGGNVEGAQEWFGRAKDKLRELSKLLDEDDPKDATGWTEVYGLPVEFSSLWAMFDLQALDTEQAKDRLRQSEDELGKLKDTLDDLQDGPVRDVSEANILINQSLRDIVEIADQTLQEGEHLSQEDIEVLRDRIKDLRESKNLARRAGSRGQGYHWMIDQLTKFAKNLLRGRNFRVSDFGRYSGVISFGVFVICLLVAYFTFAPESGMGIGYIFACLIIALVAGFGYGAIDFVPLLQTYRNVIQDISNQS